MANMSNITCHHRTRLRTASNHAQSVENTTDFAHRLASAFSFAFQPFGGGGADASARGGALVGFGFLVSSLLDTSCLDAFMSSTTALAASFHRGDGLRDVRLCCCVARLITKLSA